MCTLTHTLLENKSDRTEPEPDVQKNQSNRTELEPKKVGSFRSLIGDNIYFILYSEPYQLTHTNTISSGFNHKKRNKNKVK
jgi:hypothetical protein